MKLPEGSVFLIIACLAGRAMAACDSSLVLTCRNLELLNENLLISRVSHSAVCPLLPPLFSCVERYLSTCPLSRNVFWMVRQEVFEYTCKDGATAYLASVDCFEKNDANKVVKACETQLQKNMIKHNACSVVDEFVACVEQDITANCGQMEGCVMGNLGRAYVGIIKELLKCTDKASLTHCEVPENMTTPIPVASTVQTTSTSVNYPTPSTTSPTTSATPAPKKTTTTRKGQSSKTTAAIDSATEEAITDDVIDATHAAEVMESVDISSASIFPCHGVALWLCVAAALLRLQVFFG